MKKNIVHIVLNEFTNDSRVIRQCKSLANNGNKVTVIAIWNKGLNKNENYFGFKIIRIALFTRALTKNPLVQIIKYLEFFFKALFKIRNIKPTVCHGHDPNALVIAFFSKLFFRCKLIYDSHELWSDSIHMYGTKKILFKIGRVIEKNLIQFADIVITVNKSIADIILKENNINNVEIIRNIPELSQNKNSILKNKFDFPKSKFNLIYVGNIEHGRGINKIINAFDLLNSNIGFIIMGRDSEYKNKMINLVKVKELNYRIKFFDTVVPSEVISICKLAELGISPIENLCKSYYYCLPNKIFEYIHAYLPVISSDFPEMTSIIKKYNIGLTFEIDSLESIAKTINLIYNDNNLYDKFHYNSKIASQKLTWANEELKLIDIYNTI